jgi:hypothetical protein
MSANVINEPNMAVGRAGKGKRKHESTYDNEEEDHGQRVLFR